MRGARGGAQRREPVLPRIYRVEVSEKNIKLRVVLIVLFLIIGVIALTVFVSSLLRKEAGWREIEPSEQVPILQKEFVLMYELGTTGSATAEYRAITELYTQIGSEYCALLDRYAAYEDVVNLYTINHSPNQTLTVSPMLYESLERVIRDGERYLYLAPVLDEYNSLLTCENDIYAAARDPHRDESAADYVAMLMQYCSDPDMIELVLLDDYRVCLQVSDAYLSLAQQYELEALIDFGWLKNAFIIDGIAEALSSAGMVKGHIASYDGFTRNMDTTNQTVYAYNYYDRYENTIFDAAIFTYTGDMAVVDLRAFAIRQSDEYRIYTYADGVCVAMYVDPADGYYRYAADGLLAYSDTNSCADIALSVAPLFLVDTLDTQALNDLLTVDIATIVTTDGVIGNNGTDMTPVEGSLYADTAVQYRYRTGAH